MFEVYDLPLLKIIHPSPKHTLTSKRINQANTWKGQVLLFYPTIYSTGQSHQVSTCYPTSLSLHIRISMNITENQAVDYQALGGDPKIGNVERMSKPEEKHG